MGYLQVSYDSRVLNYDLRGIIRLATKQINGLSDLDVLLDPVDVVLDPRVDGRRAVAALGRAERDHAPLKNVNKLNMSPIHDSYLISIVGPGLTIKSDSPQKKHLFISTKHPHLPPLIKLCII